MKLLKLAAAVLNQTPLDWDGNKANILAAIDDARRQGVSILCLPEMCIPGYGCEDAFHSPGTHAMSLQVLQEILPFTQGIVVSLGLPVMFQNGLFNAACLVVGGKIVGFVGKRYLAGDGIHYEPRWFKPWPDDVRAEVRVGEQSFPMGDVYFDVGGVKIGFEICEDAWVAQRPGGQLALEGVDVILNPSASHFAFGKIETRKRFVIEGSRAFGVTYVYSNLVGNEAGRIIYDGGALIASAGRLRATGPRFTFQSYHLTTAVVDIDATRMAQSRTASFTPEVGGRRDDRVVADFAYPKITPEAPIVENPTWESGKSVKEEEFTRAVSLALFDYMRKSRSGGFVVSLSGGSDSTAVVVLVRLMAQLAAGEIGLDAVKRKLSHLKGIQGATDVHKAMRSLLMTAYQGTENSGDVTRSAAKAVADAIGAEHLEFNVESINAAYTDMVSRAIGRTLSWETDDIALQNIQARVRAPGIWMLANLRNALLLATSDRSEAAVGYSTMDGDTAGGLSPIAGIDKDFLRKWLRWMESTGPEGIGPMPVLSVVTNQAPTPELRPQAMRQRAEEDLMPYDLLDAVERAAIRDKQTPAEVFLIVRPLFPKYTPQQLGAWIERFFRLWCRNQWKRERYAPSFHLDDANLDPKTWCRFPILSGGYERELAELRALVASTGEA
jgi:NAD+ synthase (glutamine-hydrolysing)